MRIAEAGFPLPAVHHVIRWFGPAELATQERIDLARLRIEKLCQDLRVVTLPGQSSRSRRERSQCTRRKSEKEQRFLTAILAQL